MPEIPQVEDFDAFLPSDDRDDRMVNFAMPRHVLRAMARDAKAHRQAQAQAQTAEEGYDTPLEPGEAGMTAERRSLSADAPPDQPSTGDPYAEAQRIFDRVISDGGREREAVASALNSLVNAAHRGDKRVVIERGSPGAWRGGMDG